MRDRIDKLVRTALAELASREGYAALAELEAGIERTRDPRHGDFASNVAMRAAQPLGVKPRELAATIIAALPAAPEIEAVEIAGPGFINFRLAPAAFEAIVPEILAAGSDFGRRPAGSGQRLLVEYVSANPTGPLHVGHGRHAAFGATLCNLFRAAGHSVDEEYYINDAGRQMEILAASVWLRYAELHGARFEFPAKGYRGGYVREIAQALDASHGKNLLGDPETVLAALDAGEPDVDDEARVDGLVGALKSGLGDEGFRVVFDAGLSSVLADIRADLEEFGAAPARWFSERSLIDSNAIDVALAALESRGLLYEQDGATWFRTTDFGDDKDRVVVRENGVRTYFTSDIAYHADKIARGYDRLLTVLGSDHHGYVPRVKAGMAALGNDPDRLDVRFVQFVVLYRGQEKVQMSTRSGEFVTLRELRHEVGNDAARFFYVSRSNDQHLEFDLELAKAQTSDNPVYYVQYAHARVASMLQRLAELGYAVPSAADLGLLRVDQERSLMRSLARFPEVVELAAEACAPQQLVHYLRELAAEFHAYYNAERILVDEAPLRDARILLALATQQVIRNGLVLLGVSAPESM